jgi:hypothetical protein
MIRLLRNGWPMLPLLLLVGWTVGRSRLEGDGYEYLLTARAFASHGSPDIRRSDLDALLRLPPTFFSDVAAGRIPLEHLSAAVSRGEERIVGGVCRARDGSYFSIHFWLYSLLLAPIHAAVCAIGASPVFAFGVLNALFALSAIAYLARAFGPTARFHVAAWLFFLCGVSAFIPWSGPEVMTASAVLVACVAVWRRDVGAGALAAGLAASQNPSAILLFPALAAVLALQRLRPELVRSDRPAAWRPRIDLPLALLGAVLAALPLLFFEWEFGTASIIASYATDTSLIGLERLFSLFFDLNQGMCVGAPGALFGSAAAVFILAIRGRGWARFAPALIAIGLAIAMAVPALAPHNWNAGTRAAMRYTVWLAMPLLSLALGALARLERWRLAGFAAIALVLQLVPVALFGLAGRSDAQLSHNRLAAFVLDHRPSAYNPIAEIFAERTTGAEGMPGVGRAVMLRLRGRPVKMMRRWFDAEAGIACPAGTAIDGALGAVIGDRWLYLDAPLRCVRSGESHRLGAWRFGAADGEGALLLGEGWSRPEADGVWTDGAVSHLHVPVPARAEPVRVFWRGHYYRGNTETELAANGAELGGVDLSEAAVALPDGARTSTAIEIELRHPAASSPRSHGESDDSRSLGFFLTALVLEGEPSTEVSR